MSEPSYLASTRASYDTVAADYQEMISDELDAKPFDRAMLDAFIETVHGTVADIGCGPGRLTAYLTKHGVRAFGIDLSPKMIAVARRVHPGLRFEVGSMNQLDLPDGELGGVVAWYSIIHTPPELLPQVFAEFHRVLGPGGRLLLAFQAGDEVRHIDRGYGHDVTLDVFWRSADQVAQFAARAGFTEVARLERTAADREKGPQAFLIAQKA